MWLLTWLRYRESRSLDLLSQRVFRKLFAAGTMKFLVVADDLTFNRLPR